MSTNVNQMLQLAVNPISTGVGGAVVGGAVGYLIGRKSRKSSNKTTKKHSKAKSKAKRTKVNRSARTSKYKPYTVGKRPDTSRRRIHRTKNGAYYIIEYKNINGKRVKRSRFIPKKSALQSKKRTGGKY